MRRDLAQVTAQRVRVAQEVHVRCGLVLRRARDRRNAVLVGHSEVAQDAVERGTIARARDYRVGLEPLTIGST